MRISISQESNDFQSYKGGSNISYRWSNLIRRRGRDPGRTRYFYELRFSHTFSAAEDKVFFSHCYPYTFTKLQTFVQELTAPKLDHLMESVLCKSLSGVDIPMLTITSRLRSDPGGFNLIKLCDFDQDGDAELGLPTNKRKKYVIVTGRVHPGEAPASWMM